MSLQMAALQRIQVFRLFDVFSLLDCLYGLRAGALQQVGVLPVLWWWGGGAAASLTCLRVRQASGGSGGGSVKAVIVDSVSAVIAPVLGGKQNEGEASSPVRHA